MNVLNILNMIIISTLSETNIFIPILCMQDVYLFFLIVQKYNKYNLIYFCLYFIYFCCISKRNMQNYIFSRRRGRVHSACTVIVLYTIIPLDTQHTVYCTVTVQTLCTVSVKADGSAIVCAYIKLIGADRFTLTVHWLHFDCECSHVFFIRYS